MDIMNKVKGWAKGLADVGVSLIALGIVLEILFNGQGIPFWPNVSVIGNVQGVLQGFSDQGSRQPPQAQCMPRADCPIESEIIDLTF